MNVAFVLFKPQSAGNVGSAARAMRNMGLSDLRLVGSPRWDPAKKREASTMAVHAVELVDRAPIFTDLPSALADRTLTIGTTCRQRAYRHCALGVRETCASLVTSKEKIAFVFGPEDHGLSNRELELCQFLATIPADNAYNSLNLAQAVMVVAYELAMAGRMANPVDRGPSTPTLPSRSARARAVEIDSMVDRMEEALTAIGFIAADSSERIMSALREVVARSGLSGRELDIFNGLARQIRWAGEGGHVTLQSKRGRGEKLR
ncbi:MAG TPA: RNA methyltransferase [Candidatus Binataceae bacterium]|jgi:tRNA/rRNA methyltransferase